MAKWKQTKPPGAAGLKTDPKKAQEWQQRSRDKAIAKLREKGAKLAPREPRPNGTPAGAPARTAVMPRGALSGNGSAATRSGRPAARKPPKHNDSPWRAEVMAARGERCRSCGDTRHVEADHIIPKSQDGKARHDVANGLPLCGSFSATTPGGCHRKKTDGELRFEFGWFDEDQIEYLAAKGWVAWDDSGQPHGRGMNHFQPRQSGLEQRKGGQHGKSIGEGSEQPVHGGAGRAGDRADGGGPCSPWGGRAAGAQ